MSSSSLKTDPEKGTPVAGIRLDGSRAVSFTSSISQRFFGSHKTTGEDDDKYKERISPEVLRTKDPTIEGDNLAIFRRLTGIESSEAHKKGPKGLLGRPGANQGIYQRVIDEEAAATRKYIFFSRLINICLGLQIIVAAALTALGAGDGPHAIVTIFGAINTVIAGFLTYLKGSGLPNRIKFFQNEWSRLRDHIEQQERSFGCAGHGLNVYVEVTKVEDMYQDIRAEIEANTPEGFSSVTRNKNKALTVGHSPLVKPVASESSVTPGLGKEKDAAGTTEHA